MCRQGASREECERVHADLSIPPVFRRNPELAHWYDQRRQRLARLDAFRTVHMGKLAVGGLYAWMALCYYALVHTVLLPLFLGEGSTTSSFFLQRLFLACGFVAFTSVLALVVVLHVLLLRSSPGHVPPSWVPSAAPMQRQHEEGNAAMETPPVQVSVVVVAPSPDTPRLALPMNIVPNDEGKEEEEEEDDEGKGSQQWQDYCSKCNSLRPLRARHCRVCNRCILKMDHHCPWINNCVGNNNFKLFFLFLCAACTLGVGACLLFLLGGFHFWHHVHTMSSDVFWWRGTLLLVNWWVSLAATAHIAMMTGHMWVNMSENATTIEQISFGPQRRRHRLNPFDLGREANVVQVMGNTSFWRWWLHPLAPPATDGFSFLMHSQ